MCPPGTNTVLMDFDNASDGAAIPVFFDLSTTSPYDFATFSVDTGDSGNYPVTFDTGRSVCDSDLGTPNAAFGGPGDGCAGSGFDNGARNLCTNDVGLGYCMAIQEAPGRACNSGNPDDESRGGSIIIDFNVPVQILTIRKVDAEDDRDEWILRDGSNAVIGSGNFINCDIGNSCRDNGVYVDRSMEDVTGVRPIELVLFRSGCFDALTVCVPP